MNELKTRSIRRVSYVLCAITAAILAAVRPDGSRVIMIILAVYCLFMAWLNHRKILNLCSASGEEDEPDEWADIDEMEDREEELEREEALDD